MLRTLLLCSVMTGLGQTTTSANADPKLAGDLGSLQGNWKPLQCEFQGVPQMPADIMKQVTVVFDKSEYHLYFVEKDREGKPKVLRLALANITLDTSATPKAITFEFAEGPFKGQKREGIYELAGNQLKLCYGAVRPKEFKAPPGSGLFLETWARQAQ